MPPDVGGQLAELAFGRCHESGRHVGLPVHFGAVEVVFRRVLDVHEDVVVLRGPAVLGAGAVVVGPDDLVQEALAAEDRVEHDLGVVHLTVVQVQVEGAVVGEQPPGLDEARFQEGPVVAERVVVLVQRALDRVVGAALEPDPVAVAAGVEHHLGFLALLDPAGVEGRVHVNECEGAVRQRREVRRVVRVYHQIAAVRRPDGVSHEGV